MIMDETRLSSEKARELLDKFGSVRKAVDHFNEGSNG
jgi:hypothetical protein